MFQTTWKSMSTMFSSVVSISPLSSWTAAPTPISSVFSRVTRHHLVRDQRPGREVQAGVAGRGSTCRGTARPSVLRASRYRHEAQTHRTTSAATPRSTQLRSGEAGPTGRRRHRRAARPAAAAAHQHASDAPARAARYGRSREPVRTSGALVRAAVVVVIAAVAAPPPPGRPRVRRCFRPLAVCSASRRARRQIGAARP